MKTNCIDMHCDTLMKAYFNKVDDVFGGDTQISIEKLYSAGAMAQFFAIYMPNPQFVESMGLSGTFTDEGYIKKNYEIFCNTVKKYPQYVAKAETADQIRENHAKGLVSAVLTVEDGKAVNGSFENLKKFYDMGVRAMALTWNFENCFGYPNSKDPELMKLGLKPFGKEAIQYMQEIGMLIDVSHLSDGGFYDIASICKKPFIASHSNSRELSPHPRNLKDDQLKLLGNAGGVTGLNVCPFFLNADITDEHSNIDAMVKHVRHIADVAGIGAIAMGSDFDGTNGIFEVEDCTKLGKLADALKKGGFTESELDGFFYKNVLRVMDDAVK